MAMEVGMRLDRIRVVHVGVGADQFGALQQVHVVQNFERRAFAGGLPIFEDVAAVGDVLQGIQVVSRGNHRLGAVAARNQKIDDTGLAAGIQRAAGLIQQQHFRIEDQDRRQRHALLLTARQPVRRAILQVRDIHGTQHLFDAFADLVRRPAKLQRAECQFIEDAGIEQLHVRILKNQTHAPAEAEEELFVLQTLFGQAFVHE